MCLPAFYYIQLKCTKKVPIFLTKWQHPFCSKLLTLMQTECKMIMSIYCVALCKYTYSKGGSMKTVRRIILIVFLIAVIAIAAVGIWQRDNIVSFVNSLRYSETEISDKRVSNEQKMQEITETTDYIDVRGGLTSEEEQALASGEITSDDAIKLVRGQTTLEELRTMKATPDTQDTAAQTQSPSASEKLPGQDNAQPPKASEESRKPTKQEIMTEKVSNIVAELYVVKSDFISQLHAAGMRAHDQFVAQGKNYKELPSLIEIYIPVAGDLEKNCDTKVNELLKQLEEALTEGGGDLSLVNEIRQYYYEEKSLTKTYYLNKYMGN